MPATPQLLAAIDGHRILTEGEYLDSQDEGSTTPNPLATSLGMACLKESVMNAVRALMPTGPVKPVSDEVVDGLVTLAGKGQIDSPESAAYWTNLLIRGSLYARSA